MIPELKAKWISALRSGQYVQAQKKLKRTDGAMCCLGVLCTVLELEERYDKSYEDYDFHFTNPTGEDTWNNIELPSWYEQQLGLRPGQDKLIELNDTQGASFSEIANWIEANL